MARKVYLHLDAVFVVALVFTGSFAFNLYQRYQYTDLLQEHTDIQWQAQKMEINWRYAKGLLDNCKKVSEADGQKVAGQGRGK